MMLTLGAKSHAQSDRSTFVLPTQYAKFFTVASESSSQSLRCAWFVCRAGRQAETTLTLWDDGHYSIKEKNPQTQFPLDEEGSYFIMAGDSIVFLPKFQGYIDTVYESIDTSVHGCRFEFRYPDGSYIFFWRSLTIVSDEKTDYYQSKDFNGIMEKYIADPYPFHPRMIVFESWSSREGYKNTYYPRNINSNIFRFVISQTLRGWEESLNDFGIKKMGVFKGRKLMLDGRPYKWMSLVENNEMKCR